jgi:hypothetical protein
VRRFVRDSLGITMDANVIKRWGVAALLAWGFAQAAHAVPLPANTIVNLPGTTFAARPELGGVVLEDVDQPFSFLDSTGHTLSGVVQNRVVKSFSDGTLDFYWRIKSTSGESATGDPGAISSFRVKGFGNIPLDADWRIDGLGTVHPTQAHRFADASFINFLFNDPAVVPSNDSVFFFLDTHATQYAKVGTYDLTGTGGNGISGQFQTFAPVPEPSTWIALAGGLLVGVSRWRRRV